MTHTYKITGMTCANCEAHIQKLLSQIEGVTDVRADRNTGEAQITMDKHIATPVLQNVLNGTRYQLAQKEEEFHHVMEEEGKSWVQTYKPILLIFAFITGVSFLAQSGGGEFSWMLWMAHFMGGFFLTFSFFKLLNLQGFADSYSMYDIIAKRWRGYAFLYAFIELALGAAYLVNFEPFVTNSVTAVVMSISLVGVLQSVLNKRKIRCACLGDVFNLPMSTVTIIEDGLMIAMSLTMILQMI